LCERAFRSRVNPAGSGSGGAVAEIPNELNAGPILTVSGNGVNTVYYQMAIFFSAPFLPVSAKRIHFFREDPQRFMREINSIQLFYDGNRWWIVNIFWQQESAEDPIPEQYL
jgi:hypothetical protein